MDANLECFYCAINKQFYYLHGQYYDLWLNFLEIPQKLV